MPIPAASSDLAAPADLADYLHEPLFAAGSDEERQAEMALRIASAVVRSRTGQRFAAGTAVLSLPATGDPWLLLPRFATTIDAVSLDGTVVAPGSGAGEYTLVGNRLYRHNGWSSYAYGPPVVTVTVGFSGEIPEDIFGATLAVAADVYENPRGLTSETVDDYAWRGSDSERGSAAQQALAAVEREYRRRPLTVPIG